MSKRETTNFTENLGGGVLTLIKNDLIYSLLSIQHLSSLNPCSEYLDITVKIKGISPIHLFNLYVPLIRSSCDSQPKSFFPSCYLYLLLLTFLAILTAIPEDRLGKDLFDWLFSSDLLPLKNPDHPTLQHRSTRNRSSPDISLISVP